MAFGPGIYWAIQRIPQNVSLKWPPATAVGGGIPSAFASAATARTGCFVNNTRKWRKSNQKQGFNDLFVDANKMVAA